MNSVAHKKHSSRFAMPSWSVSFAVHFLLLAFLFFLQAGRHSLSSPGNINTMSGITLIWDSGDEDAGTGGGDGKIAGIAPVETSIAAVQDMREIIAAPLSDVDLSSLLPKAPCVERDISEQNTMDGLSAETTGIFATGSGGIGPGRSDDGTGSGRGLGFGSGDGKARVGVFGTEGVGTRFLYVFDRSGSMSEYGGRPMRAAREELIRSLESLGDSHRFNIIFYNNEYVVWTPEKLSNATDIQKENARVFVGGIIPAGGTKHRPPLAEAIRFKPDVIFFLTDGDENDALSPGDLEDISTLNNRSAKGVQINVVQFGVGEPDNRSNFLKTLAARNGGQYVYVNISSLP